MLRFWSTACRWCKSNSKSAAWLFVKPLTRYTVTARKALTATTPCLNTCNCLWYLTEPIPGTLPVPLSGIKTALISPWTGRSRITLWLRTWRTLPPPSSRNIPCWMFCLITACLTAARLCSSCVPIRLPPLSESSGKLTAHLKRRTGQNPKAAGLSGIPQGQEKPWPALRPHVWLLSWTLSIKSSSWSTGKTSITRPWRSTSASLRTVSMVRIIQQASEETWIKTITKSSSQPFRNSITWWNLKLTCPSTNSRWCLSLMSVTAASLVRPRKTSKRNSDAFISLVLPVRLFSRRMHWGQKPPPASSGVNYILT